MRALSVLGVAMLVLAGCLEPDAPPAPVAGLPEVTTLPVVWITGEVASNLTGPPSGVHERVRVGWHIDRPNLTLSHLEEVVRLPPQTVVIVVADGNMTYADGNRTRFDGVSPYPNRSPNAVLFRPGFSASVPFTVVPCEDCPFTVEAYGKRLAPDESLERAVSVVDEQARHEGKLRFTNAGVWTVRRVEGCTDVAACDALR